MTVIIRKAKPFDASSLSHVQVTSWRSAFRNFAPDDYLDNPNHEKNQVIEWEDILTENSQVVFVVETNQQIVGYALAASEDNPSAKWNSELTSLHLLPGYKRKGLGKKLFSAAAQELKNRGCKSMYPWVLEDNYAALRFYESVDGKRGISRTINFGGKDVGETIYSWDTIQDLIYMVNK